MVFVNLNCFCLLKIHSGRLKTVLYKMYIEHSWNIKDKIILSVSNENQPNLCFSVFNFQ